MQGLEDVVGEDLGEESSQDSEEKSGKKLCERERVYFILILNFAHYS